ncbi:MAG: DEAD/DEAH box helicase [Verrucomicrobiota bacterium]
MQSTTLEKHTIILRDYQEECLAVLDEKGSGRWLVQMATGLGKTVMFAEHIKRRKGRALILSHREELVHQPAKYFDEPIGFERAEHSAGFEPVVSASIQTMANRLDRYPKDEFDTIILDEAHHAAAKQYRKVLDYFQPDQLVGVTATPNRADGAGLDSVFDEIVFERDILWAIENEWLCKVRCYRVNIGYDLRSVASRMGDFAQKQLEDACNITSANKAIAQAYHELAQGPTMIFAVTVAHAEAIAKEIPGAVALSGKSKDRAEALTAFQRGDVPCLVNCQLFTEGTDLPCIESLLITRPTQSLSLYTQIVGRGLRLYPGKERLRLIDCVGVSDKEICTAPSLIGIDLDNVPAEKRDSLEGELTAELPTLIDSAGDSPETWVKNVEIVNIWAKRKKYQLHDVRWFRHADGTMTLHLPGNRWMKISAPDLRNEATLTTCSGKQSSTSVKMSYQQCLDWAAKILNERAADDKQIWSRSAWKRWGNSPASDKQRSILRSFFKDCNLDELSAGDVLSKGEASLIIDRVLRCLDQGDWEIWKRQVA